MSGLLRITGSLYEFFLWNSCLFTQNPSVMGCYAVYIGTLLLTFRRIFVPSLYVGIGVRALCRMHIMLSLINHNCPALQV